MQLVAVDHDPFAGTPPQFIPVDHDPFAGGATGSWDAPQPPQGDLQGLRDLGNAVPRAVGSLPWVPSDSGSTLKRMANRVAMMPANAIGSTLNGIADFGERIEGAADSRSQMAQDPQTGAWHVQPLSPGEMTGMMAMPGAVGALGVGEPGAMGAFNVYHGTPHDFGRFDISKIGTGEGAQVYGHGLYFAENPDVALAYQEALSDFKTPQQAARAYLDAEGGNRDAAISKMSNHSLGGMGWSPDEMKTLRNGLSLLESGEEIPHDIPGHLYEASIDHDPEDFLHWDKPLSEQSPQVQAGLAKVLPADMYASLMDEPRGVHRGEDLYRAAGRELVSRGDAPVASTDWQGQANNPEAASSAFRQAGIPGIRYLDQGSRGAGAGTHNYVLFDDKAITVVGKNGQPVTLTPVNHDPFAQSGDRDGASYLGSDVFPH